MKTLLLAGTVLSALAGPAMANVNYSHRGGWTVDTGEYSDGSGTFCSAYRGWNGVGIGMATNRNAQADGVWMLVLSGPWNWIRDDTTYSLTIDIPDGPHWRVDFDGTAKHNILSARVDKEVINGLAQDRGQTVYFHQGRTLVAALKFTDSAAAIRDTVHCVRDQPSGLSEQNGNRNSNGSERSGNAL